MAPRERHHSDPKQSLVQSAATDIVEGFYDAAEAFQTSSPLHQPHPTNGGQHPNSPEDKVAKEKLRRQLEEAKTASKESQIHSELQNSVDSCLRQRGELSDTESIVDDVEVDDDQLVRKIIERTSSSQLSAGKADLSYECVLVLRRWPDQPCCDAELLRHHARFPGHDFDNLPLVRLLESS